MQHTYVYNGISQVLDHIFVPKGLPGTGKDAIEYQVVHVDSEFTAQASDHDPRVVRIRPVAATPTATGTIAMVPRTVLQGTIGLVSLRGFDARALLTI